MDFRILGPLEVVDERGPVRLRAAKQRALLAILLLHRNEVVSADRLIDELWGDRPPKTARKTLQMHVSHLRRVLPPGVLRTESPGYVLTVEPGQLDLDRFEALVSQARSAAPATAATLLREALALSRGPPLSDLEYEPFARGQVARLEELRLAALEERIDADHALGHHAELVGELESLAGAYPLRERIRGQLMLALYRSGRQAEALEAYRKARVALVDELGIEPGPELRDLEQAILRHEVPAPEAPASEAAGVEARTVGVFVGRDRELAELLAGLDEALAGRGGLILVGGEPGIGKSRLAGEFASQAKARGARVLSGRCWEAGGAAPYWPWVQSLRSYLRDADPKALRAELGSGASVVAQMLPEVRELVSDLPPAQSLESDGARFRLFDATATFLRRAAGTHPLVLLLDDLHAADTPSLLLLQFLAGEVTEAKILIVGTYRDVELLRDHPLRSTLAELSRHDTTRRLTLSGLSELDVSRFIALTTEVHDAEALATAIHGQTDGNPLFVDESVKLLVAEGRLSSADTHRPAIPDTVREVIAQRLAHLPEECTDVLVRAAVLGREFSPTALGRLGEPGGDEPLEVLDPAIAAHVLVEVPDARVWGRAGADRRIVPLLEEALDAIGTGDSVVRARLLARLSGALRDPPFRARASEVSRQAVGTARRLDDPATLAYALDARHVVIWGPDTAGERAAIVAELVELAEEARDEERTFQGHFWRLEALLEDGDIPGVRTELDAAARSAEELKQPAQLWYVAVTEALLALLEGRFVEAEALIARALDLGERAQSWEAQAYHRLQLYALRGAQGRLDEVEDVIVRSLAEYPHYPVFRCVLASLYYELGRREEVALAFEELAADDFAALPRDEEWLFGMTLLAPVCEALGDERRAAFLYEALSPYGDRNALAVPEHAAGSVSRSLGVLATAMGRQDDATRHFEDALAMNARMGARPWVARTQHDYGRMLQAHDPERARDMLERAADAYRALGMNAWAERAHSAAP